MLQAIPNEPDTESILESTANGIGNFFHQTWQQAEAAADLQEQAAGRVFEVLLEEGIRVRIVELPEGHDPDTYLKAEGAEAYRKRVDEAPEAPELQQAAGGGAEPATYDGVMCAADATEEAPRRARAKTRRTTSFMAGSIGARNAGRNDR